MRKGKPADRGGSVREWGVCPLSRQCGGITRNGARCTRSAEGPNGLCWLHDPTRSEDRRRAARAGGKAKPSHELQHIKARLSELADDVLKGKTDRRRGAVASQILNVLLRAVSVELKVREGEEIERRLAELEEILEGHQGGRTTTRSGRN